MNIAMIGAGKMGLPMARHLAAAGHTVSVYDRSEAAQAGARSAGLALKDSLQAAVAGAEVVFSSLPHDAALLVVAAEVAQHAAAGTVFVDTSTVSLHASATAAAACAAKSIAHVRATVSGNNKMAELAQLTVMASGPADAYARVEPLLRALGPTQFYWFFMSTISGIMLGAWWSGRLAGKITPQRQIRRGFRIMAFVSVLNVAMNLLLPPHPLWAIPLIALFAFGWSLMVPVVTLMVLDQAPDRRGMASSLQACIGSVANALVAGAIAPLVMHSAPALAVASLLMMGIGVVAWAWVKPRLALELSTA